MAILETKGQGWRAIPTQYRKANDILARKSARIGQKSADKSARIVVRVRLVAS